MKLGITLSQRHGGFGAIESFVMLLVLAGFTWVVAGLVLRSQADGEEEPPKPSPVTEVVVTDEEDE